MTPIQALGASIFKRSYHSDSVEQCRCTKYCKFPEGNNKLLCVRANHERDLARAEFRGFFKGAATLAAADVIADVVSASEKLHSERSNSSSVSCSSRDDSDDE